MQKHFVFNNNTILISRCVKNARVAFGVNPPPLIVFDGVS